MATEDGEGVDWVACIAERKIQDAIDEGLFANLPGAGKPLDLDDDPFVPPGMRAINNLLKNNKVLPPWVLLENEIADSCQRALDSLARWERLAPTLQGAADYAARLAAARREYESLLRQTNDLILKYNCSSPFVHRSQMPFAVRDRLAAFDERYPLPITAAA